MIKKTLSIALAASFVIPSAANAATTLITTEAGYAGPGIDLSAFANGSYNFTFGPIIVDNYTFTASPGGGGNSGQGSVVGQGNYGLGDNGSFGGDATYIGVDSGTGFAELINNDGPTSEIGFFFNYAPGFGDNATIEALDINGDVFASYDLTALAPISTPGGMNEFEFRGIRSDVTDIYGLRFGGNFILLTGTADGSVVNGVPEPTTWAFMIFGFGAIGGAMRRQRKANVNVSYA